MTTTNQKRLRQKGRRANAPFLSLPTHILNHPNVATLSSRATKLLIDLGVQYNGRNNGDLCAPLSLMKKRGWNSNDQLHKAKKELVERGLILVARQGGLNKCNLYALTWLPIDDCGGKLDIRSTTVAPHTWKEKTAP